jgi:hypothetical protein
MHLHFNASCRTPALHRLPVTCVFAILQLHAHEMNSLANVFDAH